MATDGDLEANEQSPLMDDGENALSPASEESEIWTEMGQPWPATFERSISLLASPVINAAEADHFTRSPKPGNTSLARRRMVRLSLVAIDRDTLLKASDCSQTVASSCRCSRSDTRHHKELFFRLWPVTSLLTKNET